MTCPEPLVCVFIHIYFDFFTNYITLQRLDKDDTTAGQVDNNTQDVRQVAGLGTLFDVS